MNDTTLIDLNFQGVAGVIACFVLDSHDGPVIVDPGPSSTLGALREGLRSLGTDLSDVRHVLLTHIHLDHAGSTGSIVEASGAKVYVHERGAPHLSRPQRLLASASQIYGDRMDALWGDMRPIPEERLHVLAGGETLSVAGREVTALYTPGHAVHHLAWRVGNELFCGDVAGIRLDARQSPRAPTPPPDIDLDVWRRSIALLRDQHVRTLHLTHYGSYDDPDAHWRALLDNMTRDAERVRDWLSEGLMPEEVSARFTEVLNTELAGEAPALSDRMSFASPPWMSVQGLARYWQKRAARSG